MLLALLPLAVSAPPPGTILVSPEAPDVPQLYSQQTPGSGQLHCRPLVEEVVLLCFKVELQDKRRYVTASDLEAWGSSPAELEEAARASLAESPLEEQQVTGTGRYLLAQGDRAPAVLLHPEWLAAAGPEPVVALPARGVVVVWQPGDDELDKVVAIGARKMFEELPHPVTSVIVRYSSEEGWTRWGEAKPR